MSSAVRPICAVCSRNARTADTPRVKVRVDLAVVWRDADGLHLRCRCHGAEWSRSIPETHDEATIESLHAFGGLDG